MALETECPAEDSRSDVSSGGIAQFAHGELAGVAVLGIATIIALVIANSPWQTGFDAFWHMQAGFTFGPVEFEQSLKHWVDDGLMAVFFFVVGLEIKREFVVGELSTMRGAALPVLAALGGMLVPAAIYAAVNAGGPAAGGWGIPMATDIAFALGVLAVLGSRLPTALKVFLTALAIADDIGAILVIALFYTTDIRWEWLAAGLVPLAVLVLMNLRRVQEPLAYLAGAAVLWFCILNSGVHATIAGVIAAMTVPTLARISPQTCTEISRETIRRIDQVAVPGAHTLSDDEPQRLARGLAQTAVSTIAPLQRLEFALHPFTTFFVLPLFALANAGVRLVGDGAGLHSPLALGVILGLLVGKPIGIAGASWIAVRLRLATLPDSVTWRHVIGVGVVGGVGFTMSLFISNLAFGPTSDLAVESKAAILAGSLFAGMLGYVLLRTVPAVETGRPDA